MKLLHRDIARRAPWAQARGLTYLANGHRLDFETSGLLLMAKDKPTLIKLADFFGGTVVKKQYVALIQGSPAEDQFETNAPIAPHAMQVGYYRVDPKNGKQSSTAFEVLERFSGFSLLRCFPRTGRTHQIRVHLQHLRLPIVGDRMYGGQALLLSSLKRNYRLKGAATERPLLDRVALHAESLHLPHPSAAKALQISSPWPKDLNVALKYLRKFAGGGARPARADPTALIGALEGEEEL